LTITTEQAVRLVEITQRKADELFEELIAELRRNLESTAQLATTEPTASVAGDDPSEAWSLGTTALSGSWEEIGHDTGVTYPWPDGNIDEYTDFVSYRGTGDFARLTLALGFLANGDVVGFFISAGGSKRGITYFFPTDDFDTTREKISMIRGGGPRGRSGFAPGEALPKSYADFTTDVLRDRKAGKWNVQGVVASESDSDTMLGHTALQAFLRGLA